MKIKSLLLQRFLGKKSHRSSTEDLKDPWHRQNISVYSKHAKTEYHAINQRTKERKSR